MKNNTKHKEIWSFGLYKESLRRLKIPAVIFFVIIAAAAVLIPLLKFFSGPQYIHLSCTSDYLPRMTAVNANPFLLVCMIAALTLTYTLFSFQNKRSSSDLYFSQPHSRLAMYTSRITALVTVIASMILIPTGISAAMFAILKQHFNTQWDTFIPYMAGCFAAAMLICAVFAIAMSITGTILNNIVVAGLIMYLPRTVLTLVVASVCSKFPLIVDGYISKFLSPGINILTGFLEIFLSTNFYDKGILSSSAQGYTFCLALVYFVIGAVLFCRRKSESAERAAPTPFMQSVYRILITMVVCLIPCGLIFNTDQIGSYEIFVIFCYYIIALLVYLFYELITTRKWKNLVKCLPGLVVVVLLNATLLGTMFGIYLAEKGFSPDTEDISYVRIEYDRKSLIAGYGNYIDDQLNKLKITDPEALDTVSKVLDRCIEYSETLPYYPMMRYTDEYGNAHYYKECIVEIKAGSKIKYRTLYFRQDELDHIDSIIESSEAYKDIWLTLPEADSGSIIFDDGYGSLDYGRYEELFDTLRTEIASLDLAVWKKYINNPPADNVPIKFVHDGRIISIPVSAWGLPESAAMIAEIRTENSLISPEEMYNILRNGEFGPNKNINILSATYVRANGTIRDLSNTTVSLHDCIDTEAELNVKNGYLLFKILKLKSDNYTEHGDLISYVYLPINEKGIDRYKGDGNGIYGIK
ncbi:MAG: hypothetical protein IJ457_06065 [Clostridia bacterium]|nr:hypothetical protein [Clostridia bacterium]